MHPQSFADAVNHAKDSMRAYDATVLRQAVRELWEVTLVGSEYHSSFLVSNEKKTYTPNEKQKSNGNWNDSATPCFTEPLPPLCVEVWSSTALGLSRTLRAKSHSTSGQKTST